MVNDVTVGMLDLAAKVLVGLLDLVAKVFVGPICNTETVRKDRQSYPAMAL